MNRSEARNVIMTILYQIFMYQNNKLNYDLDEVISDNLKVNNDFVKNIVKGVLDKKDELVKIANSNLKNWKMNRLGVPDQAILSLGIYEILYTDTPKAVVINEAIELAKKYCDEKVKNMINGVLDKVSHEKKD